MSPSLSLVRQDGNGIVSFPGKRRSFFAVMVFPLFGGSPKPHGKSPLRGSQTKMTTEGVEAGGNRVRTVAS
jgi:hypothetical protein